MFSDDPYLQLQESFWSDEDQAATTRYFVIDLASGEVNRYAASYQAYSDAELELQLRASGFSEIESHPDLGVPLADGTYVVTAKKVLTGT